MLFRSMRKITDWSKGLHWIVFSGLVCGVATLAISLWGESPALRSLADFSMALFASLVAVSAVLHSLKFVVGRRRPRDDFEHGFYGAKPFSFDSAYDSFPSGHAMTIFCLGAVLSAAVPALTPIWLLGASVLALTRAFLAAHFLSDVLIGAAMGLGGTALMMRALFPQLTPAWF